ncbi:MAG TPA: DoxX family protein [Bacteroidota bacterium]|nr:DoxX family protein [Bacteroidota bacterium]
MKVTNIQILFIRLAIGGLFLNMGLEKYHGGWLSSSQVLLDSLQHYLLHATGAQMTYLNYIAIPYAGMWSKLMTIGELAVAVSLLLGLFTRLSSLIAIFMVLNFSAANGNLFSWNFFGSPWAALLLAGLLATFLARSGRWIGLDALLAKSNSGSILW